MAKTDATRTLLTSSTPHMDEYTGTLSQLCGAGLAKAEQFPGQPGNAKTQTVYFVADDLAVPRGYASYEPTYTIQRKGPDRYTLAVEVCEDEGNRRALQCDEDGRPPKAFSGSAIRGNAAPSWSPKGWEFRRQREKARDYVFVASASALGDAGLMEGRDLPASEGAAKRYIRFLSTRFGWVVVAVRAPGQYFAVVQVPAEIRNAKLTTWDTGSEVYHHGTKAQLQGRGIAVGVPFPGEPMQNPKRLQYADQTTGRRTVIALLAPADWHGEVPRYQVVVYRTEEEARPAARKVSQAEQDAAMSEPQHAEPQSLRKDVARDLRILEDLVVRSMRPKSGLRYGHDSVERFKHILSEAHRLLVDAPIEGLTSIKPPKSREAASQTDMQFQRFMSRTMLTALSLPRDL